MSIPITSVRRGGHVVFAAWAVFAVGCSETDNNPPGGSAGTGGGASGTAGSSGHAGMGSAGQPDGGSAGGVSTAGAGGALCGEASSLGDTAYTPCTSAGSGGVSAGSGGVSAGSGGVSAGSGGVSAGSGGAGSGGVSAGSGGSGGVAGAGPGFLNVSPSFLRMYGTCTAPPETFTVSNTGGSALTWNATLQGNSGQPLIAVEPSSSTLLPGAQVTVSVNVKLPAASSGDSIFIMINSDVAAQPSVVTVVYEVTGIVIDKQPDFDAGEGQLGQYKSVQVPTPSKSASFSLGSSNPAFYLAGPLLSHGSDHWDMIFQPSVLGAQSATLEIGAPYAGGVCPASNRFITIRGVGIP